MMMSSPVSSEAEATDGELAYDDMTPSQKRAYTIAKKKTEAEGTD